MNCLISCHSLEKKELVDKISKFFFVSLCAFVLQISSSSSSLIMFIHLFIHSFTEILKLKITIQFTIWHLIFINFLVFSFHFIYLNFKIKPIHLISIVIRKKNQFQIYENYYYSR